MLVSSLLALAAAPFPQTTASASCAAPFLDVSDGLVLRRGAAASIEGRAFADGCRDSMSCSTTLGCDDCEYDDPPPTPMEDVRLSLVQGNRTWRLGVADAETAESNHLGWVTWSFDLPSDAKTGPARLLADHADRVRIRIR